MTNAETWTEIPNLLSIFVQDGNQIVFCNEMSRIPTLPRIPSQPVSSTPP